MFRALFFDENGHLQTELKPMDVAFALHQKSGVLWVDFFDYPDSDSEPILTKTFNFHPLAIDDALQESHFPKIDDWGEYLYIVLHAVAVDTKDRDRVDTKELDIFLGQNYIVTHHDESIEAIENVWEAVHRDTRHLKGGVDHILYRISDEVVGSFMPVVEHFDETLDRIETEIFERLRSDTLEEIFAIKRSVLYLRRIISPQREVLNRLARDDFQVIDARDQVYFRDVYDHLVRMYDITEGVRDLVTGTMDTYLSISSNRMNDVMKTLTIITTIFMPISFLAGFFGMNYFQPVVPLHIWTGYGSFLLALFIMIGLPVSMLIWMRSRGWLG